MLDPLELKLQTVVSSHVGAGNQTQIFCRSKNVLKHEAFLQSLIAFKIYASIGNAFTLHTPSALLRVNFVPVVFYDPTTNSPLTFCMD
ncbi:hypothetical protein ACRRTK_021868 [Alexandromys fortis]